MDSITQENYIKALFYLHQKNENISLSDLRQELKVSKSTANGMVKKLQLEGIVLYEKYKPIRLTKKGKQQAAFIIRKHRLSEMFLAQVMGFGWEEVHDIAEELEHIKVEKFFNRIDEMLDFPIIDPHGSPIPDKDGNLPRLNYKKLSEVPVGSTVVIKALQKGSTDFLLFLNRKSLKLNTKIKINQIEHFNHSYTVSYGMFSDVVLEKSICDRLLVEVI